ncbi:MAG: cation:proton antiporter, partial [Actinomycetes bacterium]
LLVGLPLTILLGFAAAQLLMPGVGVWLALLLGAALAPTDAGLGAATVLNPVVPVRVRRILNVESGLNDGLATPVVLLAIAAAGGTSAGSGDTLAAAAGELALGVLVGVLLGAGSAWLLSRAHRAGQVDPGLLSVGVLAVPLACYYGALAAHGNGFVAAFVSGTAFAAVAGELGGTEAGGDAPDLETTASLSAVLGCAVWALFGILGVAKLGTTATWRGLVFAVLSLTLVRMVPVALALVGSGLRRQTVLFVGWFGPRGLASVVFALIAIESLPDSSELEAVVGAITMTVLLSVVLHGVTAEPWAAAYGRWAARVRPSEELGASVEPVPGRARPRRARRVR